MHFVYDINLIFSLRRGIGNFLHDLTDIVNAVVGRRINLDDIHAGACGYGMADAAFSAGTVRSGVFTVYRPGKDLRHSGLARSPGSGKQIGMSDAACLQLVLQCGYDMILPLYICESIRTKLPVQCRVRHILPPLISILGIVGK